MALCAIPCLPLTLARSCKKSCRSLVEVVHKLGCFSSIVFALDSGQRLQAYGPARWAGPRCSPSVAYVSLRPVIGLCHFFRINLASSITDAWLCYVKWVSTCLCWHLLSLAFTTSLVGFVVPVPCAYGCIYLPRLNMKYVGCSVIPSQGWPGLCSMKSLLPGPAFQLCLYSLYIEYS